MRRKEDEMHTIEVTGRSGRSPVGAQQPLSRRSFLTAGAVGVGAVAAARTAGPLTNIMGTRKAAPTSSSGAAGLYAAVGILTTASYWEGPKAALKKMEQVYPGVKTEFTGITGLNDSSLVTVLDEVLTLKPKGLMIEPADPTDVQAFIKTAEAQGVPCLNINSQYLPNGAELGYVGFSRKEQGQLVAQELVKRLPKKKGGTVVGMVFDASAVAMVDVYQGFKSEMALLRPDLKVIEEVDKADVSYGSTLMGEVLTAHPDIVGIGGLDTTAGQAAANAVQSTGRKDVKVIAGALDEAQTQYWPLLESGVIQACVLSSSFEQFWTAMQFLVNLNTNAIDGINWRANKEFRVVPKNVDLGSFTVTKADVPTLKSIKLI